jgi:hypothetical protein
MKNKRLQRGIGEGGKYKSKIIRETKGSPEGFP